MCTIFSLNCTHSCPEGVTHCDVFTDCCEVYIHVDIYCFGYIYIYMAFSQQKRCAGGTKQGAPNRIYHEPISARHLYTRGQLHLHNTLWPILLGNVDNLNYESESRIYLIRFTIKIEQCYDFLFLLLIASLSRSIICIWNFKLLIAFEICKFVYD